MVMDLEHDAQLFVHCATHDHRETHAELCEGNGSGGVSIHESIQLARQVGLLQAGQVFLNDIFKQTDAQRASNLLTHDK